MSYARFGWDDSDVYLFHSEMGYECCSCWLNQTPRKVVAFQTPHELVEHLAEHRAAGHTVPQDAIDELIAESEYPEPPE